MKTHFKMQKLILILLPVLIISGCANDQVKVTVKNNLPLDRIAETVEISIADITANLPGSEPTRLVVTDPGGTEVTSQLIYAGQSVPRSLIFQADVKANSSVTYLISVGEPSEYEEAKAYGRFVPERYDDYTWENDQSPFGSTALP